MVTQLGGMDAAFIGFDTGSSLLHGVGVVVLEPGAPAVELAELVELVQDRLPRLDLLRRRLVSVPGGLDRPYWVEVVPDVADHIHAHRLPPSSDPGALEAFCADVAATKLDPDRPMWEFHLVSGLEGDAQALVIKVHHSLSDGIGALALIAQLFDLSPDGPDPEASTAAGPVEEAPGVPWLLANAALHAVQRPIHAAMTVVDLIGAARRIRELVDSVPGLDLAAPLATPHLPFDGPVSTNRSVAFGGLPLDRVKAVARASGTHVNDVVLAVLAGTVRDWLQAQGDVPDQPLVAAVPVSTRGPEELLDPGNHVSTVFVHLPTNVADPQERLEVTAGVADRGKDIGTAVGPSTLDRVTELLFPALLSAPARLYQLIGLAARHPAPVNLIVSNVAGPPFTMYLGGRPAATFYALGPIFDGVALNITVISYRGVLGFAFVTCPDRLPDIDILATGLDAAFEDLAAAYGVGSVA